MPLQLRADARTRPMQEDALVAVAQSERLAHLFRTPAADVAQRDRRALRLGQLLDRRADDLHRLRAEQGLFGQCRPVARVLAPVSGERLAGVAEALRLDGRR